MGARSDGGLAGAGSAGQAGQAGEPSVIPPSERAPVARGIDVIVFNDKDAPAPRRDTPPTTCNDVGTFAGTSSCCKDQLCIGSCARQNCACGSEMPGGCPWPLVCCGGGIAGGSCVGPDSPFCRTPGKGQNEKDKRPLVDEGTGCGVPSMPMGDFSQMCCNGEVCQGRCTLYPELGKGVCDCNHAVGGAHRRWNAAGRAAVFPLASAASRSTDSDHARTMTKLSEEREITSSAAPAAPAGAPGSCAVPSRDPA